MVLRLRIGPNHARGHLERVREEPTGHEDRLAICARRVGACRAQDLMLDYKGFARIKNRPHSTTGPMSGARGRVLGSIGPSEVMVLRC